MATTTTIKVPTAVRDRVNREAAERGISAAALIEELVDDYERRQRLNAFGRAFADADYEYRSETDAWSAAEVEWPNA